MIDANYVVNQYGNSEGNFTALDRYFLHQLPKDLSEIKSTWRSILDKNDYKQNFNIMDKIASIPAKQSVGNYIDIGTSEPDNLPTVGSSSEEVDIHLYTKAAKIETNRREEALFYHTKPMYGESDFYNNKIHSANVVSERLMQHDFFYGTPRSKEKGFFGHTAVRDVTSMLEPENMLTSMNLFTQIPTKVREKMGLNVNLDTLLISPALFRHLIRDMPGATPTDLEKMIKATVNTDEEGEYKYLNIRMLDELSSTVTPENKYGYAYMYDKTRDNFAYHWKPVWHYSAVDLKTWTRGSAVFYMYSDMFVYNDYSIVKVKISNDIDAIPINKMVKSK